MIFTMKYTAHPERRTAFEKAVAAAHLTHCLIPKSSPWRNGLIERSHRTDNDECFSLKRFLSSEERRYFHRLWEYEYNFLRPHQAIHGSTPFQRYCSSYPTHAFARTLI
jgi:transposase InsO family protein